MTSHLAALSARFLQMAKAKGYHAVDVPVLHPTDLFMARAGETFKSRLLVTEDGMGRAMCLRPDYTLPIAAMHAAGEESARRYSYCGPVFRKNDGRAEENLQAGIEDIGHADPEKAEREILAFALHFLEGAGHKRCFVRLGDGAILHAIVAGLQLGETLSEALLARLSGSASIATEIDRITDLCRSQTPSLEGLKAVVDDVGAQKARACVIDLLKLTDRPQMGTRSHADVAEGLVSRAAMSGALDRRTEERLHVLRALASIEGPAQDAMSAIARLCREEGIAIDDQLQRLKARLDDFVGMGLKRADVHFSTDFHRRPGYHSGAVFEIYARKNIGARALAAGGRYDDLLSSLGTIPTSAIGCSFWLNRIGGT